MRYSAYVLIMLLVASLDELLLAILQGCKAYQHMAIALILRSVLRLVLSALLLYVLGSGVMALIYSWIISFGIAAGYEYLVLPLSRKVHLNRNLLVETLRFGFPLQLNRFLWFVSSRINTLLIGALIGPSSVAIFGIAERIPNALLRLTQSYNLVYFPTTTELLTAGKKRRTEQLLDRSLRLLSFSMACGALIAVLFSQQIVTLFFSDKYAPSSPVFALLMIGLHVSVVLTLMGYTLTAAGYPKRSLGANLIRESVMIVADLLLIPALGVIGPAIARLVAQYTASPLSVWLLRRSDIRVAIAPLAKQTVLLWLCSASFWLIQPTALAPKTVVVVLFVLLSVALSTISRDDLSLVLPRAVTKRMGIGKEALPNGRQ